MPASLDSPNAIHLDHELIRLAIDEHTSASLPKLERLWTYYRNPSISPVFDAWSAGSGGSGAWGGRTVLGQEIGLPARLRPGRRDPRLDDRAVAPEIVVENDIAWRLHTMIDLLFGRPIKLESQHPDPALKAAVEHALEDAWERSGGRTLLHDVALLGHVYGHVDLIVRDTPAGPAVEPIDPCHGIPLQSASDYRQLDAYIIRSKRITHEREPAPKASTRRARTRRCTTEFIEVFEPGRYRLFENDQLQSEHDLAAFAGRLPIVHAQNLSQPFHYAGLSEVEPLIPLQDELNTRLSDRASRVTLQCFRMYFAKGIDGFTTMPIGPGRVFSTDNMAATIEAFGGDTDAPSEQAHIDEVREALDKISGVPPVATGVVRAKVGNLTSANALRLTLVGALAKTQRKQATYGRAIVEASELILAALDHHGTLRTKPEDRRLKVVWPSDPLPTTLRDEVELAKAKRDAGLAPSEALSEIQGGARDTHVD